MIKYWDKFNYKIINNNYKKKHFKINSCHNKDKKRIKIIKLMHIKKMKIIIMNRIIMDNIKRIYSWINNQ
jgi:hypothetical protein